MCRLSTYIAGREASADRFSNEGLEHTAMFYPSAVRSSGQTCQSIHTVAVVPTTDVYLHHCMSVHSGLLLPIICSITKTQHILYRRQCQGIFTTVSSRYP